MKKTGFLAVVASLMLSLTALAGEKSTDAKGQSQSPTSERKAKIRDKAAPEAARSPKALTDQLAAMKKEHQAAMNELQEIKKLAVEEKATKTVGALEKLMARHEQEYQKKIEPLQQRLKKLEGTKKQGTEAPKDATEKTPRKGNGKKASN